MLLASNVEYDSDVPLFGDIKSSSSRRTEYIRIIVDVTFRGSGEVVICKVATR